MSMTTQKRARSQRQTHSGPGILCVRQMIEPSHRGCLHLHLDRNTRVVMPGQRTYFFIHFLRLRVSIKHTTNTYSILKLQR